MDASEQADRPEVITNLFSSGSAIRQKKRFRKRLQMAR